MTVIKAVKDRNHHYSLISKSSREDISLSFQAFGFLAWALGKPDDWRFYITQISAERKIGIKKVNSCLNELIEKGYAFRWQPRMKNGDFLPAEIVISDSKEEIERLKSELYADPKNQKMFTVCRSGITRSGISNKEQLLSNDSLPITEAKESIDIPPLSSPLKKAKEIPPKIPLPQQQSLRSDEEDLKIPSFLDGTILSEKQKLRLIKSYPLSEIKVALKLSQKIKIKKGLMNLLVDILKNPENYETPENQLLRVNREKALLYNEKLRIIFPESATKNERLISEGSIKINESTYLSLKAEDFLEDISICLEMLEITIRDKHKDNP